MTDDGGYGNATIRLIGSYPVDWLLGDDGIQNAGFVSPDATEGITDPEEDGHWSPLQDWPLLPIHVILTTDHKLLTFGANDPYNRDFMLYDVYDLTTGEHTVLSNLAEVDMFCSVPFLVPETGDIMTAGGFAAVGPIVLNTDSWGNSEVVRYDPDTMVIDSDPLGGMDFERWYPTAVTLASGEVVILGGTNTQKEGIGTPEVYTAGIGMRQLPGAYSAEIATDWSYPRAWPTSDGKIFIMTSDDDFIVGHEGGYGQMLLMDPTGDGSIEVLGDVPFNNDGGTPAIMYGEDLILHQDVEGQLWSIDISAGQPQFELVGDLGSRHNFSDMTHLPDGRIFINGGSLYNQVLDGAHYTAHIWDPSDNSLIAVADQGTARLYHSNAILLPDGTVMSMGGGAPGPVFNDDAQVYRPDYLFDATGQLADRLQILDAPTHVSPGDTFSIAVNDPSGVARVTVLKHGSVTHSLNMEARFFELEFSVSDDGRIEVQAPANANVFTPGAYMIFVLDENGVPSTAATISADIAGEHRDDISSAWVTLTDNASYGAEAGTYHLTDSDAGLETGVVAFNERLDLDHDIHISLTITVEGETGEGGLGLLLHNDPAKGSIQGAGGSGLGAMGVENGIAILFDPADTATGSQPTYPVLTGFDTMDHASVGGGSSIDFTVENGFDTNVQLNWVSFSGDLIPYGTVLVPGETHYQQSYTGHNWVVTDATSGEVIANLGQPADGSTVVAQFNPADFPTTGYSSTAITFTVENLNGFDVTLNWISWDGRSYEYETLAPGESVERPSYLEHTWYLTNTATGEFVDYIGAPADGATIVSGHDRAALGMTDINPSDYASHDEGLPMEVFFLNENDFAVNLNWIDPNGNIQFIATVPPGATQAIITYTDHNWVVENAETGQYLDILQGLDQDSTVRLNYAGNQDLDPDMDMLAIVASDSFELLANASQAVDIQPGQQNNLTIDWDASEGVLTVTLNGQAVTELSQEMLASYLGGDDVDPYFAITASDSLSAEYDVSIAAFEAVLI